MWKLILGFAIFLLVVQFLFFLPAPLPFFEAVWEAGDLISFVGTITLGIITVIQSNREAKINERLMQLEEDRYKFDIRPFVIMEDYSFGFHDQASILLQHNRDKIYVSVAEEGKQNQYGLSLELVNTTASYILVSYNNINYLDSNDTVAWNHCYTGKTGKKLRLGCGESGELVFWGNRNGVLDPIRGKRIKLELVLENRFGERYCETMEVIVIVNGDGTSALPDVHLEVQNYRIGKYVKNCDGKIDVAWEDTHYGQP